MPFSKNLGGKERRSGSVSCSRLSKGKGIEKINIYRGGFAIPLGEEREPLVKKNCRLNTEETRAHFIVFQEENKK